MRITNLADSKSDFVKKKLLVKTTNKTEIVAVSATISDNVRNCCQNGNNYEAREP